MWKDKVREYIDGNSDYLIGISDEIHRNPEIAFKEVKASRLLADELKKAGFDIVLGAAGMDTAIVATHPEQNGAKCRLLYVS